MRILVACHKADPAIKKDDVYMPIQVGKAIHPELDLGFQCDNTGDNISNKNDSYCELTALYWAWKNLKDIEYIGLCHYRRYFDFHRQCKFGIPVTIFPSSKVNSINVDVPKSIYDKLDKGYVVTAKPQTVGLSLANHYCLRHVSDDFRTLQGIICQKHSKEIQHAFFKVMYRDVELRAFNMFLMKWSDFDSYCRWLFELLSDVEKNTKIENYSPVQRRIYGYMAERLLNVWLYANKKGYTLDRSCIFFDDKEVKQSSFIRYKTASFFYKFINCITVSEKYRI